MQDSTICTIFKKSAENSELEVLACEHQDKFYALPYITNNTSEELKKSSAAFKACSYNNMPTYFILTDEDPVIPDFSWIKLSTIKRFIDGHGEIFVQSLASFWSKFPYFLQGLHCNSKRLPIYKNFSPNSRSVTVYGGTFNPWHDGHGVSLKLCPEENIVVVPDSNPWKGPLVKQTCPWGRLRNLEHILKETPYALYPGFIGLNTTNPTVNWLPHLDFQEINMIIGDDNFMKIDMWNDFKILLKGLKKLYVVPRNESLEVIYKKRKEILEIVSDLEVNILSEHDYQHLSSGEIRAQRQKEKESQQN
jgi:nicotinate-nucleotide adenylyltransferase